MLVLPVTVAVNCCDWPTPSVTLVGETLTCTGGGVVVTVTCAEPDFVGSATDVAVTVTVIELPEIVGGAVYNPLALIVPPPVTDHVTL